MEDTWCHRLAQDPQNRFPRDKSAPVVPIFVQALALGAHFGAEIRTTLALRFGPLAGDTPKRPLEGVQQSRPQSVPELILLRRSGRPSICRTRLKLRQRSRDNFCRSRAGCGMGPLSSRFGPNLDRVRPNLRANPTDFSHTRRSGVSSACFWPMFVPNLADVKTLVDLGFWFGPHRADHGPMSSDVERVSAEIGPEAATSGPRQESGRHRGSLALLRTPGGAQQP